MTNGLTGKYRVRLNIRGLAESRGIKSGYQFRARTGYNERKAYLLWNESWKQYDAVTLAELCEVFNCDVNKILILERNF